MALRVARGLFRLWLVLSVLWIGGVGVVTWWSLPVDEFVLPSDLPDAPWVKRSDPSVSSSSPSTDELPQFDPSKPYIVVKDKERGEAIRFGSVLALVPPAFVLALGSALVWAFRGFR